MSKLMGLQIITVALNVPLPFVTDIPASCYDFASDYRPRRLDENTLSVTNKTEDLEARSTCLKGKMGGELCLGARKRPMPLLSVRAYCQRTPGLSPVGRFPCLSSPMFEERKKS